MSTISCLVENFTLTVSFGFSSVYNLLPDPFGFLPVPTLGSLSFIFSFLELRLVVVFKVLAKFNALRNFLFFSLGFFIFFIFEIA